MCLYLSLCLDVSFQPEAAPSLPQTNTTRRVRLSFHVPRRILLIKGNTIINDGGESDGVIRKKGSGAGNMVCVCVFGWGAQVSAEC